MPETLERRILTAFADSTSLYRKTSYAVSYVHGLPDYNGHVGIRELCDTCPARQFDLCSRAHQVPTGQQIREVARMVPEARDLEVVEITSRAAVVSGLADEQPRYYLQHALGFQVHDEQHPHHARRHGRADIGWEAEASCLTGQGWTTPWSTSRATASSRHFATRIHGIINQDVADAPDFKAIADEVGQALDVPALVAHIAHADIGVLKRYLPKWDVPEVFYTLKLARRLLPNQSGYKLGMLARNLNLADGLPAGLTPHRAAYDALVAARLFVRLATSAEGHPLTLEELRGDSPEGDGHDAPSLF